MASSDMAAGPKADLTGVSGRMRKAIEDQVEALSAGVVECLGVPGEAAESRAPARNDAAKLVSATAALLQALARVKGELHFSYQVNRSEDGKPVFKKGWSGYEEELLTEAEFDAMSFQEQIDYSRWTSGRPPRFNGWKKPQNDMSQAEIDAKWGDPPCRPETPSPSQNSGSNGDGGKP